MMFFDGDAKVANTHHVEAQSVSTAGSLCTQDLQGIPRYLIVWV